MYCGVIPVEYDATQGREAHMQPGNCFWDSLYGKRFPGDSPVDDPGPAAVERNDEVGGLQRSISDPKQDELAVEEREAKDRDRALLSAARSGDAEGVAANLEAGADINATDGNGWTALVHAIRGDHVGAIEALTAAGAKTDTVDAWGRTPMMYAAMLHQRLWPHDSTEGETDSLEWLKDPERGGAAFGATLEEPNIDWRLRNNKGADWEGRQ